VKTIAKAIASLGNRPRIYLCVGAYEEKVKITTAVSIFGGFKCDDWTYSGTKAAIRPPDDGPGLTVESVSSPIVLADLAITMRDATAPGASSLGMFVTNSTRVTLKRMTIATGKGADGKVPGVIAPYAGFPIGFTREPDRFIRLQCPAPLGSSSAGGGGTLASGRAGLGGYPTHRPSYPNEWIGFGGSGNETGCTRGLNGSYGLAGKAPGTLSEVGRLTSAGWEGANGFPGGNGATGQGGGGGGGKGEFNGEDGFVGGCGGLGGEGGQAGGSSIALLSYESGVHLDGSELQAGSGGKGGAGGNGQAGQGGLTYINLFGTNACDGGSGGSGGSGAGGGGGAGGSSIAVAYHGAVPLIDGVAASDADVQVHWSLGAAGTGGSHGAGGGPAPRQYSGDPVGVAGADGVDGIPGVAKAIIAVRDP
jgi:hypothetical protein